MSIFFSIRSASSYLVFWAGTPHTRSLRGGRGTRGTSGLRSCSSSTGSISVLKGDNSCRQDFNVSLTPRFQAIHKCIIPCCNIPKQSVFRLRCKCVIFLRTFDLAELCQAVLSIRTEPSSALVYCLHDIPRLRVRVQALW